MKAAALQRVFLYFHLSIALWTSASLFAIAPNQCLVEISKTLGCLQVIRDCLEMVVTLFTVGFFNQDYLDVADPFCLVPFILF